MLEKELTVRKTAKRLYLYIACIILVAISSFLLLPKGEYLIGIALLGLASVYLISDIYFLLTYKKAFPIVPFEHYHQSGIDSLMVGIQDEFEENISSPGAKTISELWREENQKYWVALAGKTVIGTTGIVSLENNNAALKRFMVAKEFRGNKNVAKLLLQTTLDWAKANDIKTIYLGTMSQMGAAHRFYEKNGFTEINEDKLPKDFPSVPVDTVFYQLEIKP